MPACEKLPESSSSSIARIASLTPTATHSICTVHRAASLKDRRQRQGGYHDLRERLVFPLEARPGIASLRGVLRTCRTGASYKHTLLKEIAAEKVLALTDRARNEPRDLYDLWHLVCCEGVELDQLLPAITSKLAFRNLESVGIQETVAKKEARLKVLWAVRLANQLSELPAFDQVFREFRRAIRQSGLP